MYGRDDPGVDNNPTEGRVSSLVYYKKALSYFMLSKLLKWTVIAGSASDNPSKSQEVNDLIGVVIKKEKRGICVKPSVGRLLTKSEFFWTLNLMEGHETLINRLSFLAMIKFQFHIIGRNDDTAHITKDNLACSVEFPQFLKVK